MNGITIRDKQDTDLDDFELRLVAGRWLFGKPIGEDDERRVVLAPVYELIRPTSIQPNGQITAPFFLVPLLMFAGCDRVPVPRDSLCIPMLQLLVEERALFKQHLPAAEGMVSQLRAAASGIQLATTLPKFGAR